ncbi:MULTISPECIES: PAAR domain-containing protein [Paraburkholderia]|uniref:PAAR domain-containing protein n=1 Tax=Paraburkholderia TaxID=1822464 RepID=UPI0016090CD7|nr:MULTISPECIES: PAAR domain-containing protein [Paraburkholderia]
MIDFIRIGDQMDHGGNVETGSSSMLFDGRYVARKGDRVSCSKHPEVTPNFIEDGDTSMKDDGIPIARHGHRVTCGCHLISSLV